jgi:3-(3-hydroxy-phenyl)propionate hydroxylase
VRVRYQDLQTSQLEEIYASYVVGCDGARSLVRRLIGSELIDLGFHERWLVLDVLLKRDRPDLGDYSIQHCDPHRPATYIRSTGNRRRWEITVRPEEDAQTVTRPAKVWELLAPWITPDDAELERAAVYTFHSAIAARWRDGRLLLAGDSAHQTPPFLGQGMCAGIRDAANLAWKLRDVVDGRSNASLLDTYQSERSPHVREFIELAIRLGGLINTRAIDAALAAGVASGDAPVKLEVQKPLLGPGLGIGHSGLVRRLAPQFTLANGQRSDDRTGYAHVLLVESSVATVFSQHDRTTLANAGIVVLTSHDAEDVGWWLQQLGIRAALVRPDRYLLGTAQSDADLAPLIAAASPPASVPTAA